MTLSEAAASVDRGVWVSVTELAEIKRVSPQAISKRLKGLEARGAIASSRRGRAKVVRLAEWDQATDDTTDPARLLQPAAAAAVAATEEKPAGPVDGTYAAEAARAKRYEADLKQIALQKELGQLVAVQDVEAAMVRCAEALVRGIDMLPHWTDDFAAAFAKGGAPALRDMLKAKARELRATLSDRMNALPKPAEGDEEA